MTTTQSIVNVTANRRITLPAALSGRMDVSQGFDAPDLDSLRIVITGRGGTGKSNLAASNPRAVLFDLERQPRTLLDPQCTYARIKTTSTSPADDLSAAIEGLIDAYRRDVALQETLKTVAIDSFDTMVDIFTRQVCKEHGAKDIGDVGAKGKGYALVRNRIFRLLDDVHAVGLGWVLIAHENLSEVGNATVPKLTVSPSFRDQLVRSRDMKFKMDCVPGNVMKKLKDGRQIPMLSKDPKDREYRMFIDTSIVPEQYDTPKSPVPIGSGLLIPGKGGWQTLRDAYAEAVEKRRAEVELDTAAPKGNNQTGE